MAPVAVLGGTFNPIHLGHLRSALELRERLALAEVRLMPAANPPHRSTPVVSAEQRAELVRLAIADEPGLLCDERELQRTGPSYTYDSLLELRGEIGAERCLVLVMGRDAFAGLSNWYRWQELTELAHLVVMARPGQGHLTSLNDELVDWLQTRLVEDAEELTQSPSGCVHELELRPLDISSTEIRELLAAGRSVRYLVPDAVWRYLQHQQLYTGDS
jgi:nicotinate-nucleotide adenylyltransferase